MSEQTNSLVLAKVHRDIEGKVKTVTRSKNPDGRYFASMLVEDGIKCPESSTDGNVIGIDLGLTDFAVTSEGSKYQHPRATKKHEKNLARKQKKLARKSGKCGLGVSPSGANTVRLIDSSVRIAPQPPILARWISCQQRKISESLEI